MVYVRVRLTSKANLRDKSREDHACTVVFSSGVSSPLIAVRKRPSAGVELPLAIVET